jgi:DNA-binding FadR family transcriptional regulator
MLAELLEIRALLDAEMCGLAAERHTAEELADIEACVARIASSDPEVSQAAFEELGATMARASHNRLFVMLSNWHRQITRDLAPLFGRVRSRAAEVNAYELLLDALRHRDRVLAQSLTAQFHQWANRELIQSVKGDVSCSNK